MLKAHHGWWVVPSGDRFFLIEIKDFYSETSGMTLFFHVLFRICQVFFPEMVQNDPFDKLVHGNGE